MINDNTILSSFNDRPTLLEWLKKVEEALKSDTATGVSVENPSVNSYIFKITFADGKTIASDTIRFPDSVKGVSILNNHLVITMQSGATEDLGVINPYAETIVSNSDTGTTEIRNNAVVDGNLQVNGSLKNLENIVDSHGRHRFFDMPLTLSDTLNNLGLNMTYGKIGLSGNHLSIVAIIANKSGNTITIPKSSIYAFVDFHLSENSWVMSKIYPLETNDSPNGYYVAKTNAAKILSGWNLPMVNVDNIALEKTSKNDRLLITSTNLTESAVELPSNSSLRITVDLLIDLE